MIEKKLIIVGAGNIAREILYTALMSSFNEGTSENNRWKPISFVIDSEFITVDYVENLPVSSFENVKYLVDDETEFILGTGSPATRNKMFNTLINYLPHAKFASIIHPRSIIMPNTTIARGVYIAANSTIAIGCQLKEHSVINQNVSIGHDCVIGNFSIISPGSVLSGKTLVGDMTFLGSCVVTYPGIQIGENCTISSGVVVSRNLKKRHKQILKPNTMILPD